MRRSVKVFAAALCNVMAVGSFLCLTGNTVLADGIAIDATNFPDANFRELISEKKDNGDGVLSTTEVEKVTNINVAEKGIKDLTGIEYFTELTYLNCGDNQLTSLDISNNTKLSTICCNGNQLTALDVSKNTNLSSLYCYNNQLTALDVSKNTNLYSLYCYSNQLKALDISMNTTLSTLYCYDNQLTSLDVSNNTKLYSLYCNGNKLTTLDLSKNTELYELLCYNNPLPSLDISSCTHLSCAFYYDDKSCSGNCVKYIAPADRSRILLYVDKNTCVIPSDTYEVWVNGEQFTRNKLTIVCGNGTATYNADNNEITLKDAEITKGTVLCNSGALNVSLEGSNSIKLADSSNFSAFDAWGDLKINGNGSLDVYIHPIVEGGDSTGQAFLSNYGDISITTQGKLDVDATGTFALARAGSINVVAGDDGKFYCSDTDNSSYLGFNAAKDISISANSGADLYIYSYLRGIYCNGGGNAYLCADSDSAINIITVRSGVGAANVEISGSGNLNIKSQECGMIAGSIIISDDVNVNVAATGFEGIANYSDSNSLIVTKNLVLCGLGEVSLTCEAGNCVCLSDSAKILLDGSNRKVTLTSSSGCKAITGNTNNPVAGENYDGYEVTGSPESDSVIYTIKSLSVAIDMGGHGTAPKNQTVLYGRSIEQPTVPVVEGWKFVGWYIDKNYSKTFDFSSPITSDSVIYAKWVVCNHENTTVKNAKETTVNTEGYTGDTYCIDCGAKLADGKVIPTLTPSPTPTDNHGSNQTPTASPATPTTPELSVGDFIDRCYEVAFGREADEAGYNYWVDSLNNGQACGAQVGFGFIFSQEYVNRDRTNEEFVKDMYAMYFGREADEAGFNYWVEQLNNNTATREDIMAGFANSEEFFNLCGKYGVTCGTYLVGVPNDQQGGVNCFVARLYKVCLNRLPDLAGQAGWVQKLMNGEVTGSICSYGFVFSPEFINLNLDNTDFVKYMYRAFFGREADEAGLTYWVDMLNGGAATREEVFSGFTGSPEFANLCASYGIRV